MREVNGIHYSAVESPPKTHSQSQSKSDAMPSWGNQSGIIAHSVTHLFAFVHSPNSNTQHSLSIHLAFTWHSLHRQCHT